MPIYFSIYSSVFLSAFLLFAIQPLLAKYLLPFFGGAYSVWTIVVFFFTSTLLVGYLYASFVIKRVPKILLRIHALVVAAALGVLTLEWLAAGKPLLLSVSPDAFSSPAVSLILILVVVALIPTLTLASTSVLMQHVYTRTTGESPYFLYALSNAGSLLGLAAYPFLLEPFMTLTTQAYTWFALFVVYAMGVLVSLITFLKNDHQHVVSEVNETTTPLKPLTIVFLAAIPTFALAATTEFITKSIASFPLLWVVPLMLYLISFIIGFRTRSKTVPRYVATFLAGTALLALALMSLVTTTIGFWIAVVGLLIALFVLCTYFHATLYDLRPHTKQLGSFYVYLTLGGATGSGIVGLLLPILLSRQVELYWLFAGITIYGLLKSKPLFEKQLGKTVTKIFTTVVILFAIGTPLSVMLALTTLATERNFYGTLSVYDRELEVHGEEETVRFISNGSIIHGLERLDLPELIPLSYYRSTSGLGKAMIYFEAQNQLPRMAVVGMGVGMLNAYCDEVTVIDYFEINPLVIQLAYEHFSYLDICLDKVNVFTGDGRLLLDDIRKAGETKYDLIVIDAFTDDSIPVHLLTLDVFEKTYVPLLSEDGILAFHISNRHLDLSGPVAGAGKELGMKSVFVTDAGDPEDPTVAGTNWMVLIPEALTEKFSAVHPDLEYFNGETYVWTDEKSSILQALSKSGSVIE